MKNSKEKGWFWLDYLAFSVHSAPFDLEPEPAMATPWPIYSLLLLSTLFLLAQSSSDTNHIYSPCFDTKVQRSDGFTFGILFAPRNATFVNVNNNNNAVQLSPCDRRLSLPGNSQLAVFRPKVDEISLLTINTSNFFPVTYSTLSSPHPRKKM